jgi:hypothetical protein
MARFSLLYGLLALAGTLSAQECTTYPLDGSMYLPIFANVRTSPIDQPSSAWAPNEGIDRGESLELQGVARQRYVFSADPSFFIQADDNAPVRTDEIDERSPDSRIADFRMLVESPDCSRPWTGYDNIRVRCTSCPEAPIDPFRNEYVIVTDSVAFNSVGPQNWSNVGSGTNDIPLNGREVEAWRAGSNFAGLGGSTGNLLTGVQRSTPLPFNAYPGAKELIVSLSDIRFNGRHYEQSGMAAGVGASLLRWVGPNDWIVVGADFRELNTGSDVNFAELKLDLSERLSGETYAVAIWRVSSLRITTGTTQESWTFPGNVIGFEIRLRAPLPPPPPPARDNCGNAQEAVYISQADLPATTASEIATYGSTATDNSFGCGGIAGDVWLTFEAESSQKKFFARSARDSSWAGVTAELLRGSCGNLTSLQCEYLSPETGEVATLDDLTIGERYYLRLTNSAGITATTGRIRYHLFGERVACTPAEPVQLDTTCLDISNFSATIDVPSLNGQEVLYLVNNFGDTLRTITEAGAYSTGPTGYATSVQLLGDAAGCDSAPLPLQSDCNTDPVINDECTTAFSVPITHPDSLILRRGSGKFATSSRATSGDIAGTCGAAAGAADFWWTVTNTSDSVQTPVFDLRNGGAFTDYVTHFYRGDACTALTYLDCSPEDDAFSPGSLSPGEQFYLRVALTRNRVPGFEDGFAIAATTGDTPVSLVARREMLPVGRPYPNPVSAGGRLRLPFTGSFDGLTLHDQLGRTISLTGVPVRTATDIELSIPSHFLPGVYRLRVLSGGRVGSRTILVR